MIQLVVNIDIDNFLIEIPYSPFGVCPSEVQYSSSTMMIMMMSSTSSGKYMYMYHDNDNNN